MAADESERGFNLVGSPKDPEPKGQEPMTFSALVLSLSTSAMLHLGMPLSGPLAEALGLQTDDESGRDLPIDLAMGQQTIEMLELLRTKTRGNLEADEEQLLKQMIHDLKLRFVEVKRAGSAPAGPKPTTSA